MIFIDTVAATAVTASTPGTAAIDDATTGSIETKRKKKQKQRTLRAQWIVLMVLLLLTILILILFFFGGVGGDTPGSSPAQIFQL